MEQSFNNDRAHKMQLLKDNLGMTVQEEIGGKEERAGYHACL